MGDLRTKRTTIGAAVGVALLLGIGAWLLLGGGRGAATPAAKSARIDWEATISADDRRWLDDVIPQATPDPFSDDLDEVMASLEPKKRKLVVIFHPARYQREIVARAWALDADTMTGDASEIERLLEHLERPVEFNEFGDYDPESPDQDTRAAALYGVARAVASGRYADLHPRIERVAIEHARAPVFRMNAAIILTLLGEHGGRSPAGEAAFAEAMGDARIAELLVVSVRKVYTDAGLEPPE
jgi:hypothetical protein